MTSVPPYEGCPATLVAEALGGGPNPGQLGVIAARPGLGKTLLLVQFGLERLVRGQRVLHVALRDSVEHVRAHYDEALRAAVGAGLRDPAQAAIHVERERMIHSWLDRSFDATLLGRHLDMLAEVAQFRPTLLLIDGLEHGADVAALAALASARSLPVWLSIRAPESHLAPDLVAAAAAVVHLVPDGRNVAIHLSQLGQASTVLPQTLDGTTLHVARGAAPAGPSGPLGPEHCLLFSGGANGAEAAFGAAAERWGMREVNFTFDGHKQVRSRGSHLLSPRELAAGDVSLKYVSARLHRTYANESGLIKKVLQTLWHMVSRSQQIFVIGQIQEDGTVVGGTGWSVELARMWSREVWVFDQERLGWFRWEGGEWSPGQPVLHARYVCGTGTRYLTPEGQAAIDALFDRTFGSATR